MSKELFNGDIGTIEKIVRDETGNHGLGRTVKSLRRQVSVPWEN
jgi:ATP-dependent exoDNAse (exonuclease V) alpha subunit